ncbi:MAG: polyphenol oxidase family protein [Anaerolineaceae bacterium]
MGQAIRHSFRLLTEVPGLLHGVFTRHGGVSRPPYAALNVGWSNGDSPESVRENLHRVKREIGVGLLASGLQVHGDAIHVVDEEAIEKASPGSDMLLMPPGDALVTKLRGVGLLIKIADCQAIFLVDPVREVIANVHCGWRGSVQDLPVKVVRFLQERFGCNPRDILATISPSLGPCCAEFRNYREELPESFHPFQVRPLYFDFWALSRRRLTDAGLRPEHIETAHRCTACNTHDFFSYRGEGATGRMAAVLGWREEL